MVHIVSLTSTGMAKPIPAEAPLGENIEVFIPINFPELLSKGPPLFPGFILHTQRERERERRSN